MPRKFKERPKCSHQFLEPLYGVAWPAGDTIFVAGGGGSARTGIFNKIVWSTYSHGQLKGPVTFKNAQKKDEERGLDMGDDCPQRLVLSPCGRSVVASMGRGGFRRIDISHTRHGPKLVDQTAAFQEKLQLLRAGLVRDDVKCMAFNRRGDLLAIGYDNGSLRVLAWPSLRLAFDKSGADAMRDMIRDVDFSHSHDDDLMAATCEDGSCTIWHVPTATCIAQLPAPKGTPRAQFTRCRFSRIPGQRLLYTLLKAQNGDATLVEWALGEGASPAVVMRRMCRVSKAPVTAFEISRTGRQLALGTTEGGVMVLDTERLAVTHRVDSAHLVFVTGLAFAESRDAVASVGADAAAYVLDFGHRKSSLSWCYILMLLLLLATAACAAWIYGQHGREGINQVLQDSRHWLHSTLQQLQKTEL